MRASARASARARSLLSMQALANFYYWRERLLAERVERVDELYICAICEHAVVVRLLPLRDACEGLTHASQEQGLTHASQEQAQQQRLCCDVCYARCFLFGACWTVQHTCMQLGAHSCNRPCRACVLHACGCLPLLAAVRAGLCIYTAHIFTYIPARCAQACVPVCVCVCAPVLLVLVAAASLAVATNATNARPPPPPSSSSASCASARVLAGAGLQLLLASPTAAACPCNRRTRSSSSSSSILIFLGECGGDCDGRRLLRLRACVLTLPHHTPHTTRLLLCQFVHVG
jgi:hypothetical protein